jgi:hypothetical protein
VRSFVEFLQTTAEAGRSINTLFEERLFAMVGTLEKIAGPLTSNEIPYEVIGGMAVMIHVNRVDSSAVRNTKDVDIMIKRADLERVKAVGNDHSFTFRHVRGVDMLLPPGEKHARNAVHLVFAGEMTGPQQLLPNPPLRPERLSVHGVDVGVVPVLDLMHMKLSCYRDIDRVHVRDMDAVGLVTPQAEAALAPILLARLQEIRSNE